eukprot:366563-Chlamydomonas_euryale.AAC.8
MALKARKQAVSDCEDVLYCQRVLFRRAGCPAVNFPSLGGAAGRHRRCCEVSCCSELAALTRVVWLHFWLRCSRSLQRGSEAA